MKRTGWNFFGRMAALAAAVVMTVHAVSAASAPPAESELIGILQSDASPGDKAIACKQLAIYGGEASVPPLAALLPDERLSSWSRIALEAIPHPSADAALRTAMGRVQGRLLVGVINSIGTRRDPAAVAGLSAHLNGSDLEVIAAAGVALGRIGGTAAAESLTAALSRVPPAVRAEVAEGCILCAEHFLAQGDSGEAVRLYEKVRAADVPKHKVLEAIRGSILARGSDGLPLLLEQLRSPDQGVLEVALRTARELPGREVTAALVEEIRRSAADRQGLILLAVGDRNDPLVLPAVTTLARAGSPELRIVAVGILEGLAQPESLPVLLEAAVDEHEALAQAAQVSLARFGGAEVDAVLVERLSSARGDLRRVLIELAAVRGIERAVPLVLPYARDPDPAIRHAAVEMVGLLGTLDQVSDLVGLLPQADGARDRSDLQKALLGIAGREGERCVAALRPLTESTDRRVRMAALQMMAAAGGAEALNAVTAALEDDEEPVRDEAVRTLASWPNTWPEDARVAEPLLALAKSGEKPSHKVQGVRGYLQFVREDRELNSGEKLRLIEAVLPWVERTEEKRLVISVLGVVPSAGSLEMLMGFAEVPDTTEEACQAIVKLATGPALSGGAGGLREKALRTVVAQSKNETTRRKANELL